MTGRARRVGRDTLVLFGLAIVLVCVAWGVGFASSFSTAPTGPVVPDDVPVPGNFNLYGEAWSYVDREFYGAHPPSERVVRGAVQGLVETLDDPHAAFMAPESSASASVAYQPTFVPTMGLWFEPVGGGVQVLSVLPESPAAKAGLVPGDVVLAVGQEPLAGVAPEQLAAALDPTAVPTPPSTPRGPSVTPTAPVGVAGTARTEGAPPAPATAERRASPVSTNSRPAATSATERPAVPGDAVASQSDASVTLIARGPDAAPRSVTVSRGRVTPPAVSLAQSDAGVPVLRLGRLDPSVVPELDVLLDGPVADTTALVIDLRDNPGGDLDTLAAVAGRFFEGPAWLEVRTEGTERGHDAGRPPADSLAAQAHLVVLVNEGTAGTAEMLAGALRDRRQAKVVGARSFGRGTVQSEWVLDDGSWLRMTTAEWRTPAGTPVEGVGIEPDESVSGAEAQLAAAERAAAESARGG